MESRENDPNRMQFLDLTREEQSEVYLAVFEGRAVNDVRLAPFAVDYANAWQHSGGPMLYRKWWYWLTVVPAVIVAYFSMTWIGAVIVALSVGGGPALMRRRASMAPQAEAENRKLL